MGMLERTARTPAWRPSRRALQNRRMLHSAFWRHGAGDLDLPSWCYVTMRALFESPHNSTPNSPAPIADTPYLDFLYPPATLSYLRKTTPGITSNRQRGSDARSERLTRQFTSSTRTHEGYHATSIYAPQAPQHPPPPVSEVPAQKRTTSLSIGSDAGFARNATNLSDQHLPHLAGEDEHTWQVRRGDDKSLGDYGTRALHDFDRMISLRRRKDARGHLEQVWQRWSALTDEQQTSERAEQVAVILSSSSRRIDAARLLDLLRSFALPLDAISLNYLKMVAHLTLESYDEALSAHDNVLQELSRGRESLVDARATEYIVTALLGARQWTHLLTAFNRRRQWHLSTPQNRFTDRNAFRSSLEAVLARSPTITQDVLAYVDHLGTLPGLSASIQDTGRKASSRNEFNLHLSLLAYLLNVGLPSIRINDFDFGSRATIAIIRKLYQYGLATHRHYEQAINLAHQWNKTESLTKAQVLDNLKVLYALYFTDSAQYDPTAGLMASVITSAADVADSAFANRLIRDWKRTGKPVTTKIARVMMRWHASRGEKQEIEDVFAAVHPQLNRLEWSTLYPLLQVDAMRADPEGVRRRLNWALEEHSLEPDIIAYGILQYAYFRADDSNGLMNTFSQVFERGLTPNAYTFSIVMAFVAHRGDVELTERFYRMATSYGVRHNPVIDGILVQAYVRNDEPRVAERLVEEITERHQPYTDASNLSKMWSQLLVYHAMQGEHDQVLWLSRRMSKHGVPFDAGCYAAVMRSFVAREELQLAEQTLARMMTVGGLQPTALHFAMLIEGCATTMQFEKGLDYYTRMLESSIEPELSSRVALLQLVATASRTRYFIDSRKHPGVRFDLVEELLDDFLSDKDMQTERAGMEPRSPLLNESGGSEMEAHFFDVLLRLYSGYRNVEAIAMLFNRYEETLAAKGVRGSTRSLKMLQHIMLQNLRLRQLDKVKDCWLLAKERALEMATTGHAERRQVPMASRGILSRILSIYIRALHSNNEFEAILDTFQEVIDLGFHLNYLNWNTYVQILCVRGKDEDAFAVCEKNLMRGFPGYQRGQDKATLQMLLNRSSYGLKHFQGGDGGRMAKLREGNLTITYKTLGRLLFSWRRLEREATTSVAAQHVLDEIRAEAPKTLQAVLNLPIRKQSDQSVRALFGMSWSAALRKPGVGSKGERGKVRRADKSRELESGESVDGKKNAEKTASTSS